MQEKYTLNTALAAVVGLGCLAAVLYRVFLSAAVLPAVGLPAAVANAMPEVKKLARFVTRTPGGQGAVREFVDMLLTCQGKRDALLDQWMHLE